MKEETKEHLFTIIASIIIGSIVVIIMICIAGCAEKERTELDAINDMLCEQGLLINELKDTMIYDPNAPELSFLEVAEPNWVRDYGDSERTRHLYNTSKQRGLLLRDQQIMTIIAQRLIALESLHAEELKALADPNEVKE